MNLRREARHASEEDVLSGPALPIGAVIHDGCESDARHLRSLLRRHAAIELIPGPLDFAAANPPPGLVFMDPSGMSAALADWLRARPTDAEVVFTASSEKWTLEAFEFGALDYLLKPVSSERLAHSIRRLLRLDWGTAVTLPPSPRRLFVAFERGRRVVALDDVCAIRALGNYTQVWLADGKTEVVLRSLIRWQEVLPADLFVRAHRTLLVNRNRIGRIDRGENEERLLEVEGLAERFPVSRRLARNVRRSLTTTAFRVA